MIIDVHTETQEITGQLKRVEGYPDCERIVIANIKKHLERGFDEVCIKFYLDRLAVAFEKQIAVSHNDPTHANYMYAAGVVNILLKTARWKTILTTIYRA
jgi:hypothetical protein